MTSTLTRPSQAVAEWSKVFPRQATETYTSSVTFIKQLTVVAVSTITYLKNIFPEDNYTIDQFGGLKIRVLKNKCEDELAQFLISSLTQAFEAFDKKYLHQLALCFYAGECGGGGGGGRLLEYHVFEYGYGPAGATVSVRAGGAAGDVTLTDVRDRTVQLLRACMVMLSHTQLPDTYDVSLRLYYNDDAPEGYQAPGFSACGGPALGGARLKLGSVRTPFHRLQLHSAHSAHTPSASENTPELSQQEEIPSSIQGTGNVSDKGASQWETPAGAAGAARGEVRCECGLTAEDEEPLMRTCSHCGTRQHAVCYGELSAASGAAGGAHGCVPCGVRPEPGLARAGNRPCYALFRRALWLCRAWGAGGVSARRLCGALALGAAAARKLLRVLRAHGVLAADPPALDEENVDVVPAQLEAAIIRYFHVPGASHEGAPNGTEGTEAPNGTDEAGAPREGASNGTEEAGSPCEDDIAERLLRQSQGSAEEDPLGAVLSPLERVSLAGAECRRAPAPAPAPAPRAAADATLAQYRSALAPLAGDPPAPPRALRKRKQDGGRKPGERTKRMKRPSRD